MGTRADFYIKKAEEKELIWLGSTAWDGYPDGMPKELMAATTPEEYQNQVNKYFEPRKDVTLPERGWPWPWETSDTTDFAYCFHEGKVYTNNFGHGWHDAEAFQNSDKDDPEIIWDHPFPNMSSRKNVRYDADGSGVIIIQG